MKKINESLLIGVDFNSGKDRGVLLVRRKKPNESVDIINSFFGADAEGIYNILVTKKEEDN